MAVKILINEQHSLLDSQKELLKCFDKYEIIPVPAQGWNKEQMREIARNFKPRDTAVFVSPIPLLLALLCRNPETRVFLFHNDTREKKELPNGRIVYTIPPEGWELIEV